MELVAPDGSVSSNRLLVDSGFTGESALVLAAHLEPMAHGYVDQANAAGALSGAQTRVVVQCRVPGLAFDEVLIAIAADITELALPPDVDGMAGLTFLRRFTSWGAERDLSGDWSFFLSDEVKEP
jgi:hypothetical protein